MAGFYDFDNAIPLIWYLCLSSYKQYYIEPAFDTAVIFEGSLSPVWDKYKVNNYINTNNSTPPYSAALIHTTPTISDMQQAINKAIERNIDYVYVTDAIMDNPWYALPSFWDAEVAYIEVLNSNASSQNSYRP